MQASVEKVVHPRDIPPDRAVLVPPTSLEELQVLMLARLQPLKEVLEVGVGDQKQFASIILGEMTAKWGDFQMQISDPFLSPRENQEVKRLVAVEMVWGAQELFMDAIKHAARALHQREKTVNQDKELFSIAANMSRLRAQLAWNTSDALSIQRLRFECIERVKAAREQKPVIKTGLLFGSENNLKELDDITVTFVKTESEGKERIASKLEHLEQPISMFRSSRTSALENLPTSSFSKQSAEHRAQQRVRFGHLLSEVEIPKFEPKSQYNLAHNRKKFDKTHSMPVASFEKDTDFDDGDDDAGAISVSEFSLTDKIDSKLLQFETELRAQHLQEKLNRERKVGGEESDESLPSEEEELPPLLYGIVAGVKQREISTSVRNGTVGTINSNATSGTSTPYTDKLQLGSQHSFPPNKYERGSSTYTPSLSQLSHTSHEDALTREQLSTRAPNEHPVLGPDPINKDGPLEQPNTILIERQGKPILEVTGLRISDRNPHSTVLLRPFEPVFNPLTEEIAPSLADDMDNKLYEGDELKQVYAELQQMLSAQHSDFESYPEILPTPSLSQLRLPDNYTSNSTLHLPKRHRILNSTLVRGSSPPWGEEGREAWTYSHSYQGQRAGRKGARGVAERREESSKASRQRLYNSWRRWWESHFTAEDYLMWSAQRDGDFLGAIFHLFDSEDSEDEVEAREAEAVVVKEGKKEGSKFTPGFWNVTEGAELEISQSNASPLRSSEKNDHLVQEKLYQIWEVLETPGLAQSEMAIKYGTQTAPTRTHTALNLWLQVARDISKRECILKELESFERSASDPLRFFTGPATAQLDESKFRERMNKRLKNVSNRILPVLLRLRKEFGDIVTYRGFNYSQKMSRDIVQMLYWLEQERSEMRSYKLQHLWRGHEMPPSLPPMLSSKLL